MPLFIGLFILSNLFFFLVLPDVGQSASFIVRVVRCFSLHSLCERAPREVSWAYQQTERSSGDRHRIWQVGSGKLTVLLCEMFEVKSKWSMKLGKSVHHLLSYFFLSSLFVGSWMKGKAGVSSSLPKHFSATSLHLLVKGGTRKVSALPLKLSVVLVWNANCWAILSLRCKLC